MELQEQLKEIKTQLRLSMNGVVSQSMREKGLDYKLNFGVELPRIREIASGYEQNHDLAQTLWKENIRESKILAAMLQPIDSFFPEIADIWVEDMHYSEIAELTCMNLFQYLPYAPAKAFRWIADDREYFQLCGFLLAARLFMRGLQLNERAESEFFDQSLTAMQCESFSVRKAAMLSLKKYGLQGHSQASNVNKILLSINFSSKEDLLSMCEEIRFEIEYLL
ncbi:MAG: DNA alkylation repair protein [Bacteroides sp.]